MRDLGVFLLALSIPYFLVYLVGFSGIGDGMTHDSADTLNEHLIGLMHAFNCIIVAVLWNRHQQSQSNEDLLDSEETSSNTKVFVPVKNPILKGVLFPLAFLVNLAGMTYMILFAVNMELSLSTWLTAELPLLFVFATSIPGSLIGGVFYYRLMNS
ncbi:MAG: hypothetical protein MK081_00775 [Flavobacteriales bacterium]|nr:hypothetical protein [Flavobacteriales bacterium]